MGRPAPIRPAPAPILDEPIEEPEEGVAPAAVAAETPRPKLGTFGLTLLALLAGALAWFFSSFIRW
jgi:hypothetical protein